MYSQHTQKNFGMTVAESLANGTPVITTTNAPWAELNARKCGWSIDLSEDQLTETLLEATALDEKELSAMGFRGRQFMEEKYSWESVALQMKPRFTAGFLVRRDIPSCVRLD